MKLSPRIKFILAILAKQKEYITIRAIADELGLSSRTVQRELGSVEAWLSSHGVKLEKKKSKGIKINASKQEKERISKQINSEEINYIFTPWERQIIVTSKLLRIQEPKKLYSFTTVFNVSEGTISHDLDKIEKWLEKYKLELMRRPGLGIYLKGNEKEIRNAIFHIFYEVYKESGIFYLVKNNKLQQDTGISSKVNDALLKLIHLTSIQDIKKLINNIEQCMGYEFADNAYISLVLRTAITLERAKNSFLIKPDIDIQFDISKTMIYTLVKEWANTMLEKNTIVIPESDITYISMHIFGAKVRDTLFNNKISMIEDYKLIKLAKKIIHVAEIETKCYLEDNEKLLVGLVRHLGPAIKRMKMNLEIQNSLLDEIKAGYSDLFKATAKSVKVLEDELDITVPEAEIAYIATHIGAAIRQKTNIRKKKYLVAVACPNGIGASKLLASQIESEFPDIKVAIIISALDISEDKLKELSIDFIVSTIPIEKISKEIIVVNYILSDEDKIKIRNFMNRCVKTDYELKSKKTINLKEKLNILALYSKTILEIFNHFLLIDNLAVKDINELITKVSATIVDTKEGQEQLIFDFRDREEKGSTLLGEKGMMLLHCRSIAVKEVYFIVIRTSNYIRIMNKSSEESKVNVIVVMVAPLKVDVQALEVLSEISKMIISKDSFSLSIQKGVQEEIYTELSGILDDFYQEKTQI